MRDFVQSKLPSHLKIKEFSTRPLTAVGDNWGSSLTALTILVVDEKSGAEKTLHWVAKMCPTDPALCRAFQVERTFVKESAMYTTVAPILQDFQSSNNIPEDQILDSFIECYGSRVSLDPTNDTVDDGAVLLLENICYKGYQIGDKTKGFDLENTEFILRHLAQFHAVLIAFRKMQPEMFQDKVLPCLNKIEVSGGMDKETLQRMRQQLMDALDSIPEIYPLMARVKQQMAICQELGAEAVQLDESPFNTFCHEDLWVNNLMIAYEKERPARIKILDFQFIKFGYIAEDIVFFLFTAVDTLVLTAHFDHLLDVYYRSFVDYLQLHKVSLEEYSKESFVSEIENRGKYQLLHVLHMCKVFFLDKTKLADIKDDDEEAHFGLDLILPGYNDKLKSVVLEFDKRGWLMEFP